jgi:hypothetical protein
MTPQDFIRKWKDHALTERASAQEHFIDLCRLMDHPTPAEDDPKGERFTFEKGAAIVGGGDGWADVWKKGFFDGNIRSDGATSTRRWRSSCATPRRWSIRRCSSSATRSVFRFSRPGPISRRRNTPSSSKTSRIPRNSSSSARSFTIPTR